MEIRPFNDNNKMETIINHFNGAVAPLFSYLRINDFANVASLNKTYLRFTHKYFSNLNKKKFHPKISDKKFPHSYLFKVRMQYSDQFNSIGILRPISIKNIYDNHFVCYGWIISCNKMPKTGGKYRPFPYKVDVWENGDNPIIKAILYKAVE